MRLTIISNENDIRVLFGHYFEQNGHAVRIINPETTEGIVTETRVTQPNAIIIKVSPPYPRHDIYTACKTLHQDELLQKVPIAIISPSKDPTASGGAFS